MTASLEVRSRMHLVRAAELAREAERARHLPTGAVICPKGQVLTEIKNARGE